MIRIPVIMGACLLAFHLTASAAQNLPPTLEMPGEKIILGDDAVTLAVKAKDPDGGKKAKPLSYRWTQISGPSPASLKGADGKEVAVSRLVEGEYRFRVAVTDPAGDSTAAEMKVVKRAVPASSEVDADDPAIQYFGRFVATDPKVRQAGWAGASIRARFEGPSIRARLVANGWGGAANFHAIIDGRDDAPVLIGGDNRTDWLIADDLRDGVHTIEIVRLDGAWKATASFRGFHLEPGKKLATPPPRPVRRIEFYGDSITEGSYMADQPFNNAYRAYAATTARVLGAETSLVCKGGMGLVKGYTLPQTLPAMYDRTLPMAAEGKWDFARWQPHVVVVNIGQNDHWTFAAPDIFLETYVKFIRSLRGHYPKAHIVCALGSMNAVEPGSKWPAVIESAVERIKTGDKDPHIETFFFEYLGKDCGHPTAPQARVMAEKLAAHLKAKGPELWAD